MPGRLKIKTGRRADPNGADRALAREWVDLYRQAQRAPGGKLCLNPADEPELQAWIDGSDPEHLLSLLSDFAEHGTFQQVGDLYDHIRLLPMRNAYREARLSNQTHERTVKALANEYGLSPRTVERKVRTDKS